MKEVSSATQLGGFKIKMQDLKNYREALTKYELRKLNSTMPHVVWHTSTFTIFLFLMSIFTTWWWDVLASQPIKTWQGLINFQPFGLKTKPSREPLLSPLCHTEWRRSPSRPSTTPLIILFITTSQCSHGFGGRPKSRLAFDTKSLTHEIVHHRWP